MSFRIIGEAFELPLVGNDKLVFLALCENADDTTRTCYPSYSTIQRKASLVNSSLKTALKVLEAVGLISIKIRSTKGGGRTSSLYKISEFNVETFDVKNYKKIAKEIRAVRNFRENKLTQSLEIDGAKKYPNLRRSKQKEEAAQPPKSNTILGTQPPRFGEEPLTSLLQPLASREEEEAEVCETKIVLMPTPSTISIPAEMAHLPVLIIEKAIDMAVARLSRSSPAGYRRNLLNGLAKEDEGWVGTVMEFVKQVQALESKPFDRTSKRKLGELRSSIETRIRTMQSYDEPFDAIMNDVRGLVDPHINSFPREELEKIILEELYKAGFGGVA